MKKELSRTTVLMIIALVSLVAIGVGWYAINRDTAPIYKPELRLGGRKKAPKTGTTGKPALPGTPGAP